jgi:hypothetical protein
MAVTLLAPPLMLSAFLLIPAREPPAERCPYCGSPLPHAAGHDAAHAGARLPARGAKSPTD